MARSRRALPQLGGDLFLTDGGIETTLIFHDGLELPDFAAFDLLKRPDGERALRKYFRTYAALAKSFGAGLILESATWRASADWGARLGYDENELADANRRAIGLLENIRDELDRDARNVVISGCVGPRGDGYHPVDTMSDADAAAYHQRQIETFANTAADMVTAITMNYAEEAVGIARAAESVGMPVAISFTVETDGRPPHRLAGPEGAGRRAAAHPGARRIGTRMTVAARLAKLLRKLTMLRTRHVGLRPVTLAVRARASTPRTSPRP